MNDLGITLMVASGIPIIFISIIMAYGLISDWFDGFRQRTKDLIFFGTPPVIFLIGLILYFV